MSPNVLGSECEGWRCVSLLGPMLSLPGEAVDCGPGGLAFLGDRVVKS